VETEIYEEWLKEVTHGLPWYLAQKLIASIEQDRKLKAASIARRLLGHKRGTRCPVCHGSNDWCDTCLGKGVVD
jgi:hypothetical protein